MKKFDNFKEFSKNANLGDIVELIFKKEFSMVDLQVHEKVPKGYEKKCIFITKILGYLHIMDDSLIALEATDESNVLTYMLVKGDHKNYVKEYRIYE